LYLRNGWHALHGVARGPMAPVVESMAGVPETDLAAIAAYVVSVMGPARLQRTDGLTPTVSRNTAGSSPQSAPTNEVGATIYAAACASCHESDRPLPFGGINPALSIDVSDEEPTNLLHVVLDGLPATGEARIPIMPGFANTLSDRQLVALFTYLRGRFAGKPLWKDVGKSIGDVRDAHRACATCATGESR
jgi:mono/diheme cytochrome c family protein